MTPIGKLFPPGTATSIGSLPHTDAWEAAALVLDRHPVLPAAPQLPNRSPAESMLAQVAAGLPGVDIYPSGNLRVDATRLHADAVDDAVAAGWPAFDGEGWLGLRAFLDVASGRNAPVKVQLAGPVTLGLALVHAGIPFVDAFEIAARAVRARAKALCAFVEAALPDAPIVAFLDEPGLTTFGTDLLPLKADRVADLVSGGLAALKGAAATAVHCCGATDWRIVTLAGPDIISLPASEGVAAAPTICNFIDSGGWVAWGAVPSDGPIGEAEHYWRALTAAWCEMTVQGCDPGRLRQQSLLTPECGLVGHGRSQADRTLSLVAHMALRAEDHALAARLAIGA